MFQLTPGVCYVIVNIRIAYKLNTVWLLMCGLHCAQNWGGVFFVQVKTQLSYGVFIIILTTCFGPDNGPSSGHKTSIWGYYTVWFIKWDMVSYNSTRSRCRSHSNWTTTGSRWITAYYISFWGTTVAQWLRCCATNWKVAGSNPAGVSRLFTDTKSFRSHYGPGVDSASNRNEYQEYFLWVKTAGA